MGPELGQASLIIAWVLSCAQSFIGLYARSFGHQRLWLLTQITSRPAAIFQCCLVAFSFVFLTLAFVTNDFTVAYVAQNSNTNLPLGYKISAVWGGHEGSLLLWVLVLSLWYAAVAIWSRHLPGELTTLVLTILALISAGFLSFTLFTSNPFARLLPSFPVDGQDLNPLLQDFGLIVHPPMLYMGYVGFSVAFAFAIAGLIQGRLDTAWAKWARPWTIVAWAFLGMGIALGSWWAYYELGWGGWWFWDPVENASFMPWLSGTALIHSLAVTEKRAAFKNWTLFLAILTFSLSLLGTFLVRSGVLTSVHAFASDPTRGLFILVLLAITVGGSLLLFASRAHLVKSVGTSEAMSRESFLMANNLILCVATLVVFLGTLYPLFSDAVGFGMLSVGPPFFDFFFVPLTFLLLLFLCAGFMVRWKKDRTQLLSHIWVRSLGVGLIFAVFWNYASGYPMEFRMILGLALALGVVVSVFLDVRNKIKNSKSLLVGLKRLSLSYWGMHTAHLGFVMSVIGVCWVSLFSIEKDLLFGIGDQLELRNHQFLFKEIKDIKGPNYESIQGVFVVTDQKGNEFFMYPEKRTYPVRGDVLTEAAIVPGFTRDLYLSLGEPIGENHWSVRVYIKPFIRWIWLGAFIMAFGGFIAMTDRRYRITKRRAFSSLIKKINYA